MREWSEVHIKEIFVKRLYRYWCLMLRRMYPKQLTNYYSYPAIGKYEDPVSHEDKYRYVGKFNIYLDDQVVIENMANKGARRIFKQGQMFGYKYKLHFEVEVFPSYEYADKYFQYGNIPYYIYPKDFNGVTYVLDIRNIYWQLPESSEVYLGRPVYLESGKALSLALQGQLFTGEVSLQLVAWDEITSDDFTKGRSADRVLQFDIEYHDFEKYKEVSYEGMV